MRIPCQRDSSAIFFTPVFFSWIFSIWGPDFEAKRISTFVSFREVIQFFPEFPAVAYSGDCESPLPAVAYSGDFVEL